MSKRSSDTNKRTRLKQKTKQHAKRAQAWYRDRHILHKIALWILLIAMLWVSGMYGIAQWYIHKHSGEPFDYGVTFVPNYARYFDLDPQQTMGAMIDELGVHNFRLVSYWNDMEPTEGTYNFDELDWQFKKVEAVNGKISLAIGLRQPRWPECHMPTWAESRPMSEWSVKLKDFMGAVIERYKNSPALESYQLENEFFMNVFGICPDFTRERLVDEYNFVKAKDRQHPVIVSRSNNWVGIPYNEPQPDMVGISVYKRVWDKTVTKRYFEYPLPAWFYAYLAGSGEIIKGKNIMIHELQAEPWTPEGIELKKSSLAEQNKSMNAERLKDRFEYARGTGIKKVEFWGAEWWYWRKIKHNDPSLWNVAKQEFSNTYDLTR